MHALCGAVSCLALCMAAEAFYTCSNLLRIRHQQLLVGCVVCLALWFQPTRHQLCTGFYDTRLTLLLLLLLFLLLLQMRATERVMVLMRLPAVQQLEQATALQLLQHAVDTKLAVSVQQLCSLPVLQAEYDSSQSNPLWSQLWSSALVTGAPAMLRALSQLPAVRAMQQLDAQALLPLLHAAVRCQHSGSLGWLCKLPAAADITSDDAAALLQVAVDSGSRAQVAELLQLQGVQTLTPANVQR